MWFYALALSNRDYTYTLLLYVVFSLVMTWAFHKITVTYFWLSCRCLQRIWIYNVVVGWGGGSSYLLMPIPPLIFLNNKFSKTSCIKEKELFLGFQNVGRKHFKKDCNIAITCLPCVTACSGPFIPDEIDTLCCPNMQNSAFNLEMNAPQAALIFNISSPCEMSQKPPPHAVPWLNNNVVFFYLKKRGLHI